MKKIVLGLISIFFGIFIFTSCAINSNSYDIVCSSFPVYDLTTRIAGNKLKTKNLIKAGVEPHDYEMTTSDVRNLTDAKLFISIGLNFEPYASELTDDIKNKNFVCTNGIELLYSSDLKTVDPHVWLSPKNCIIMMKNIKNKLIEIDKDNEEFYETNFEANKKTFEAVDYIYSQKLSNLSSRYLVTSHEAFAYLCNDYNLEQIAIAGLSPENEPTASDVKDIIDTINSLNIKTIFYEELTSDEIVKSICDQTNATFEELSPIEGLEDSDSTTDMITLMLFNLDKIYEALK